MRTAYVNAHRIFVQPKSASYSVIFACDICDPYERPLKNGGSNVTGAVAYDMTLMTADGHRLLRRCGKQISHRISENLEGHGAMGRYGSERKGGRATVESSVTLDLSRLFKTGWLKPGAATQGVLRWTNVRTGQETASMRFEAQLGENDGRIRLIWTSTNRLSGEHRQCENSIALTTTLQPFGGRRWWFVCPRIGRHVMRLHLPPGTSAFACRDAHGLAYRSQRETPSDRAFSRAFALRWKFRDTGPIGGYIAKPKGMHWRTFERTMARIHNAEAIVVTHLGAFLDRYQRRTR